MEHSKLIFTKIKSITSTILVCLLVPLMALTSQQTLSPLDTLHAFVKEVNRGNGQKAYQFFSKPLRVQVSSIEFVEGIKDIKNVQILAAHVTSQTNRVCKVNLTIEGSERNSATHQWKKKHYSGQVVLVHEKGSWRFIQVFLKNPNSRRKAFSKAKE